MLEDINETFEQTFLVFSLERLEITLIAVRKRQIQVFAVIGLIVFVEFSVAEIPLRFAGNVLQRQMSGTLPENLLLTFGDIPGHRPVRAGKTFRVLLHQPLINPLGCMSLFALGLFILCQPFIDFNFEWIKLGKFGLRRRPGTALIPVIFSQVHPDGFTVPPRFLRDLCDRLAFFVI